MAEKHDSTVPGEQIAPGGGPALITPEPGAHTQADDIPVAFVAVVGIFFAALLVVSLVGLEAWFYNAANAATEAKLAPQGAPGSELAVAYSQWNDYLTGQGPKKDPTDPKGQKVNNVIPITTAIDDIVKLYGSADAPPKPEAAHGTSH